MTMTAAPIRMIPNTSPAWTVRSFATRL